jgi:hypothetical protein
MAFPEEREDDEDRFMEFDESTLFELEGKY